MLRIANSRLIQSLVAVSLASIVSMTGCGKAKGTSKKQAVFDTAHREIFSPRSTSEMGYSHFCKSLSRFSYVTEVNTKPLTDTALKDAKLLVLAGPMTDFSKEELDAITKFVSKGAISWS